MTYPTGPVQMPDPSQLPGRGPTAWPPAQQLAITVPDLGCGHLPGEPHDGSCDYWRGVLTGEYPHPDAYVVNMPPDAPMATDELLQALRRPLVVPAPLTDRALGGAA